MIVWKSDHKIAQRGKFYIAILRVCISFLNYRNILSQHRKTQLWL